MALTKEFETEQGFTASYWKVEYISVDRNRREASFTLNLYLNKEKGNVVDSFIKSETITLFENIMEDSGEVKLDYNDDVKARFNKYFGEHTKYIDIYEACYECAKEISPFFADAEDC